MRPLLSLTAVTAPLRSAYTVPPAAIARVVPESCGWGRAVRQATRPADDRPVSDAARADPHGVDCWLLRTAGATRPAPPASTVTRSKPSDPCRTASSWPFLARSTGHLLQPP